jgi:hypothetical protein
LNRRPPQPAARPRPRLLIADQFVPRPWLVGEIRGWLEQGPEQIFLLTGDSGTGKSVLSDWISLEDSSDDPALREVREAWDATYFCSERYRGSSTDPRTFIRQLSDQIGAELSGFHEALLAQQKPLVQGTAIVGRAGGKARVTGAKVNTLIVEGTTVEEMYQQALEVPLLSVLQSREDQRVVILVDGIDEGLGEPAPVIGELACSLARAHPAVRLFVTSKNDREATQPFENLSGIGCRRLDLSSAEARQRVGEDIRRLALSREAGRGLREKGLRQLSETTGGNFLHAEGLLEAVAADGEAALTDQQLRQGLAASYEQQLERLLRRNFGEHWRQEWESSAAGLFGVLAVAQSPLEIDDLAGLLDEDTPGVRMAIARFGQLLRPQADLISLHPTLATFLLSPSLPDGSPNMFQIDAQQAHLRVAHWCLDTAGGTFAPAASERRYALLHSQDHVAALSGKLDQAELRTLVDSTFRTMTARDFRLRLREEVADPVLLGRPYRRLAELLAAEGRGEMLEQLAATLAPAEEPALRAAALEALTLYAQLEGPRARAFICRLALSSDPTPRLVALKAISKLDRKEQVKALEVVITQGGDEVRMAAAYALYANWNTEPAALTSEVLLELSDAVSLLRPRALKPLLEFLASITITNYINNCGNGEVADLTSALWRRVFHERLHLNSLNRPFVERSVVVPVAARHFAERVLGAAIDFDRKGEDLLPLPEEQRRRVLSAVEGLDPSVPLERMADDVVRLAESELLIFRILAAQVIAIRAVDDFGSVEGLLRHLFEAGSTRLRTTLVLAFTTQLDECPATWRPLLEWMTAELIEGETTPLRPQRDPLLDELDLLFVPLGLAYCRAGERMSMHERLIASADTEPEVRRSCVAGTAIVGLYSPNLALAALEPAAEGDNSFLAAHAVETLSVLRSMHQAAVDRWLAEWGTPELREAVISAGGFDTARRHIEAVGLYTNGVHQAIHYPYMRETVLREVFALMSCSDSLREWAKRYTGTVFQALRAADYTLINWTRQ